MLREALSKIADVQKVDIAILELKKRFAAVSSDSETQTRYDQAHAEHEVVDGKLKALRAELKDLELESKKIEDKIKSENARLYSGGIYNAKDADAIDREVKNLAERRGKVDDRTMELWELIPPAEELSKISQAALDIATKERDAHLKEYAEVKAECEGRLSQLVAARKKVAEGTDDQLLSRYETMRKNKAGIGVSVVTGGNCSICNNRIPKNQIDLLTTGESIEVCEACGRILYLPLG